MYYKSLGNPCEVSSHLRQVMDVQAFILLEGVQPIFGSGNVLVGNTDAK